ncbi:MAG: hypothetical protein M3P83_05125 [Actinomycetota bacterium]|nr:hypothetical protein [Actinomycetota bacterium]
MDRREGAGREASPLVVPWRVVLLARGGVQLLPEQRLELRGWPAESGVSDVVLLSRFQDVGLAEPLPHELVLEVHCGARDAPEAVDRAAAIGGELAPLLAFAVNAHVAVPVPHLAYEEEQGLNRRRFWQGYVELESGLPHVGRRLDERLLFPFLEAVLTASETPRLARAVGQYAVALSHWTMPARPLALAHLYIALEALSPAVERVERQRLGLPDERAHAEHRGVDLGHQDWKNRLLGKVRGDVLCQGDWDTYDLARKASNGFEHASMDHPSFRTIANQVSRDLMGYVRRGVLGLLDLADDVRDEMAGKVPLDISPLQFAVEGELTGAVQDPDRLGYGSEPYPYADWRVTLDDHHRTPDGRSRMTPRMHLTSRIAEGVQMTWRGHALGAGLTDLDLLDFEPSTQDAVVIPSAEQTNEDQ